MNYRRKKVFLTTDKSKYCVVKLFESKKLMQDAYKKFRPDDDNHDKVEGVSCHYDRVNIDTNECHPEVATVFLNVNSCGAGVVTHELMHSCLWAWKHSGVKEQYPIVINNMDDEEEVLHNHTYAVMQFYDWYWKVVDKI